MFALRAGVKASALRIDLVCASSASCQVGAALRSVSSLNADSLPRAVAFNISRRSAEGDIVAAGCLHDRPDRVHNDLWLVDRYHVTALTSDHQTSSFRERGEILLQLRPILISSSCTGDDDDRDREFSARAPDFRN